MTSATTTDHFDGVHFANPTGANGQPFSKLWALFRTKRARWPRRVPVVVQPPPAPAPGEVTVTFVGHSTFLVQGDGFALLTDPIFSSHAGPGGRIGPRRVRAPGLRLEELPPISLVLLSHNHYDHCDRPTLRAIARRDRPAAITPLGNGRLLRAAGFTRITELDWWERTRDPLPVWVTPAQHFSARTFWDRNRALWGSFVVETTRGRLFFAGDSGYGPHFAEIRRRCGPIGFALLPIGAYEPRWFMKDIHLDPAEAVTAHLDLGAARSVAMHFGTFQLTPEGIDEPVAALRRALVDRTLPNESFRPLEPGESVRWGDS